MPSTMSRNSGPRTTMYSHYDQGRMYGGNHYRHGGHQGYRDRRDSYGDGRSDNYNPDRRQRRGSEGQYYRSGYGYRDHEREARREIKTSNGGNTDQYHNKSAESGAEKPKSHFGHHEYNSYSAVRNLGRGEYYQQGGWQGQQGFRNGPGPNYAVFEQRRGCNEFKSKEKYPRQSQSKHQYNGVESRGFKPHRTKARGYFNERGGHEWGSVFKLSNIPPMYTFRLDMLRKLLKEKEVGTFNIKRLGEGEVTVQFSADMQTVMKGLEGLKIEDCVVKKEVIYKESGSGPNPQSEKKAGNQLRRNSAKSGDEQGLDLSSCIGVGEKQCDSNEINGRHTVNDLSDDLKQSVGQGQDWYEELDDDKKGGKVDNLDHEQNSQPETKYNDDDPRKDTGGKVKADEKKRPDGKYPRGGKNGKGGFKTKTSKPRNESLTGKASESRKKNVIVSETAEANSSNHVAIKEINAKSIKRNAPKKKYRNPRSPAVRIEIANNVTEVEIREITGLASFVPKYCELRQGEVALVYSVEAGANYFEEKLSTLAEKNTVAPVVKGNIGCENEVVGESLNQELLNSGEKVGYTNKTGNKIIDDEEAKSDVDASGNKIEGPEALIPVQAVFASMDVREKVKVIEQAKTKSLGDFVVPPKASKDKFKKKKKRKSVVSEDAGLENN